MVRRSASASAKTSSVGKTEQPKDGVRCHRSCRSGHWRVLAWRWLRRLENELDELDDLLGTLVWGFDPDLQQFTDVAVSEVEKRRQTQCRSR